MSSGKMEGPSAPAVRRDPYEVLSVTRESSDQEIKSAYRKLALKYVLNYTFSITLIHRVSFIYHFRALEFKFFFLSMKCSAYIDKHMRKALTVNAINIVCMRYVLAEDHM